MIALWLVLIIIECYSIYKYYKKTGKIFNHLTLFSIGFFLYLILPNLIGEIGLYKDEEFLYTFYQIYNNITIVNKLISYIFIFLIYISFSLGTLIKKKKKILEDIKEIENEDKSKKINLFKIIGIILFILVIVYGVLYKDIFFKGYLANSAYSRGSFAALVLVVFSYSLLYTLNKIKNGQKLWKAILNPYVIIYSLTTILLLSIGTRMYFIANVFTILVLLEYKNKINFKKSIIAVFITVLVVGIIGMVRSSYGFSISGMIKNLLVEFLYTGLSLIKFIEIGTVELIKFPKFILSSFINLVPTIIFPDKLNYVLNPMDYGYVIYNPQGALSIYVELMINFGFVGSVIIAFISGYSLDKLRRKATDNILSLVIYSMISGFLIFSIFRDSLQGSLIKNILEFSVILPTIYYCIYRINCKTAEETKNKPTVVQINVTNYGSTGNIMKKINEYAEKENVEMISLYGRGKDTDIKNQYNIASKLEVFCNVAFQRFLGKGDIASLLKTKRLIRKFKKLKPSVIHLHNIHGYYINYKELFNYIIENEVKVVWTLHDCWSYTGHCAYYSNKKCDKWQIKCKECECIKQYPKTLIDNSSREYEKKKELFTKVKKLILVTPSNWLKEEVEKSFLNKYDIRVINNGIDLAKFKHIKDEDIREKYKLEGKKIILGVASVWDERKGLNRFIELSKLLKEDEVILLVGLNKKQVKNLPHNIIGIQRTENQEELVKIYSMADIFFNPSVEETFSLVTAEAMACGVPCIVFNETATPELINDNVGKVLNDYSVENIYKNIEEMINNGKQKYFKDCIENSKKYDVSNFKKYIELYKQLIEEK